MKLLHLWPLKPSKIISFSKITRENGCMRFFFYTTCSFISTWWKGGLCNHVSRNFATFMCWIERQKNQKRRRRREIHGYQSMFLHLEENPWLPCLRKCFLITRESRGFEKSLFLFWLIKWLVGVSLLLYKNVKIELDLLGAWQ